MGDSWEDDDFTPVVPQAVVLPTKTSWDDEDLVGRPLPLKCCPLVYSCALRRFSSKVWLVK